MFAPTFRMNTLYYVDNLRILRDYINGGPGDLIFRYAPIESNRLRGVFKDYSGAVSDLR
mgnify:CR=1 FL=1